MSRKRSPVAGAGEPSPKIVNIDAKIEEHKSTPTLQSELTEDWSLGAGRI